MFLAFMPIPMPRSTAPGFAPMPALSMLVEAPLPVSDDQPMPGPANLPGDKSNRRRCLASSRVALIRVSGVVLMLFAGFGEAAEVWETPPGATIPPAGLDLRAPAPPRAEPDRENLTERLDRTDGVLSPPRNVAPNMPVITPPSDAGTIRILPAPPPGTPPIQR